MRLLLLALRSVNSCFELPTVFIFTNFINPSMEYLIPIWWPSLSKIVQKHRGPRFSHCRCHCKTVSNSVCPREQQYLRGAGLTDWSIKHTFSQHQIHPHVVDVRDPFQIHPHHCDFINCKTVMLYWCYQSCETGSQWMRKENMCVYHNSHQLHRLC